MSNKRKARKPVDVIGLSPPPVPEMQWTPIEHSCGCVIDWGWDRETTPDPREFIEWCMQMPMYACSWHGGETGRPLPASRSETVHMMNPATGHALYMRRAKDADVILGQRISQELRQISDKAVSGSRQDFLPEIPPDYLAFLRREGYEPVSAWIEHRLVNLILNRRTGDQA